ncbi:MAG: 16S rRNA (guanine(966)-N(2))-methyltransferase RsmD [Candidatus Marinimicrobia bacterium]|nr:16S rRNA (guanine(966)-N(2))-methyltransferase RsmD [Candidatus Neomarinimicrobiota bacterium]
MVRIISGSHRGLRLSSLPGEDIRPTADRTKEWIFSVMTSIEGAKILDLFAGTGNLGIEALSRGAKSVTFIEHSAKAVELIKTNVEKIHASEKVKVIRNDSIDQLIAWESERWDIILADPPYKYDSLPELISAATDSLEENGFFILEASSKMRENFPLKPNRVKKMGRTTVYIFEEGK